MQNQQTIRCDVRACCHHGENNNCKLASITVTNCHDCATAHYCQNYEECKMQCDKQSRWFFHLLFAFWRALSNCTEMPLCVKFCTLAQINLCYVQISKAMKKVWLPCVKGAGTAGD